MQLELFKPQLGCPGMQDNELGYLSGGGALRAGSAPGPFWGSNLTSLSLQGLICLMELKFPPILVWIILAA